MNSVKKTMEVKLPFMIDYYRKQNNLTMKELGEKIGKAESTISLWISGKRSPMVEDLNKLSEFFGVSPSDLMIGQEKSSTEVQMENIVHNLASPRQNLALTYVIELERQQDSGEEFKTGVIPLSDFEKKHLPFRDIDIQELLQSGAKIRFDTHALSDEEISHVRKSLYEYFKDKVPVDRSKDWDIMHIETGNDEIIGTAKKVNKNKKFAHITSNYQTKSVIELDEVREEVKYRTLAVHGLESAGDGAWQDEEVNIEVQIPVSEIPYDYDDLAMVIGDSMRPKLHNSDILFIKFTKQIENGQIGIFRTSKGQFVKKLQHNRLESLNPEYDDIYFSEDEECEAIGLVVDFYRK